MASGVGSLQHDASIASPPRYSVVQWHLFFSSFFVFSFLVAAPQKGPSPKKGSLFPGSLKTESQSKPG